MSTHDVISETPVHIGDKVRFNPFKNIPVTGFPLDRHTVVVGEVIWIHSEHHWFSVEYMLGDVKQRTSFNFADIGAYVSIDSRK